MPSPVMATHGIRLPNVTDVLVGSENCRGAHVTTRPHNRKVFYHVRSGTWFLFHGTGHWIDKLGDAGLGREVIAWRASRDGRTFTPLTSAVGGNGHSSSADALLVGNRIYLSHARFGYWRSKEGIPALVDGKPIWHRDRIDPDKPNFYAPYEVISANYASAWPETLPLCSSSDTIDHRRATRPLQIAVVMMDTSKVPYYNG